MLARWGRDHDRARTRTSLDAESDLEAIPLARFGFDDPTNWLITWPRCESPNMETGVFAHLSGPELHVLGAEEIPKHVEPHAKAGPTMSRRKILQLTRELGYQVSIRLQPDRARH